MAERPKREDLAGWAGAMGPTRVRPAGSGPANGGAWRRRQQPSWHDESLGSQARSVRPGQGKRQSDVQPRRHALRSEPGRLEAWGIAERSGVCIRAAAVTAALPIEAWVVVASAVAVASEAEAVDSAEEAADIAVAEEDAGDKERRVRRPI